ncbi:Bromodomain-containing protein, partial [Jimgerdemannia flammicorona]
HGARPIPPTPSIIPSSCIRREIPSIRSRFNSDRLSERQLFRLPTFDHISTQMMANGLEARKRSVDEVLSDHGQEKMQRDQTSPDLTAKSKRVRVESNDIEMNLNDQAEGSVPNGAVRSPSSNANFDSPNSTSQMSPVADSQNAQADMALLSIDDLSPRTEQTFNPLEGTNIKLSDDGSTHSIDSNSVKVSVIRNGTAQQTVNDAITQAANKKTRKPSRKNEEQDQPKIMRKDSFATHTPISNGRRMGMSRDQLKYATAMIKQLKKHRDAADFLAPVDIEKYKIYDYKTIIKTPMDLGTVEQKLNNCEYDSVDAFVSDVRLIFSNCYLYNGRESAVSNLAHNLEMAFEKSLKQMPQSHEPAPPPFPAPTVVPSKAIEMTSLKAEPAAKTDISLSKKVKVAKVGSFMQPPPPPSIVRRTSEDGRPKREIHPPPSKDYPEAPSTKRNPKKNDMQLKFCVQALKELKKTKYSNIAYPFLSPVDPVKLGIPHYPKVIKNPMDISTIEKKLNNAEYNHADEFEADVRLMFRNCYTFNGPESDVYIMGRALEKIFDEKWAEKPAPPSEPEPEPHGSDASDNDDPRDQQIAALERHLAMVSQQLESMKSNKDGKRKKDKESKRSSKSARPSKGQTSAKTPKPSSKAPRPARPSEKKKRPAKNKTNTDCDDGDLPQFTFEQKRELSELINMLNGEQLSNVVQIIQTTVPNLNGGGEEEIELDIDSLDLRTLHKLHQFVRKVVPKRKKPPPKKPRVQYSVEEHDRKILELEMTLQKFENVKPDIGQGTDHDMRPEDDGETSSSGDDSTSSSGSDSEDSGSDTD